jgi:hypothetical protein
MYEAFPPSPTGSWPPRRCSRRSNSTYLRTSVAGQTLRLDSQTRLAFPRTCLLTLLTALKSLGLIVEHDGRFANAPATARFLVAGAPGDFRDYVRLVNGAFGYERFRHLTAALRGERTFPGKRFYEGVIYSTGLGGETFGAAQHSGSLGPARLMAKRMSSAFST